MSRLDYGFERNLGKADFDGMRAQVTGALKAQGFGVLTEIDVEKALREKLGQEFRRYRILGACNPHLASQALEAEAQIGLLLPCNVVVQQTDDGDVLVSIADPKAMFSLVENPALEPVVAEAEQRLRRVMESLA